MLLDLLFVIIGLVLLVGGGELLVRGASQIALMARVPPALVGLTIVAAGTSAPELVVSISAAFRGSPDLSLGNVVGSNIFNIGLILAVSALVKPLKVVGSAVRFEWPVLFLASVVLYLLIRDGSLDFVEGLFFIAALVSFLGWNVHLARKDMDAAEQEAWSADLPEAPTGSPGRAWAITLGTTIVGAGLLVGGAHLLVTGAVDIARAYEVSERIIGITLVSVGTSLPELFASVVASYRGRTDIAVGNVIGSNLFNILCILGVTATIHPLAVNPDIVSVDAPWMIGFTALLFPILRTGMTVRRWEGGVLLALTAAYMGVLFMGGAA